MYQEQFGMQVVAAAPGIVLLAVPTAATAVAVKAEVMYPYQWQVLLVPLTQAAAVVVVHLLLAQVVQVVLEL
jgi:hypothetical protein